MAGLVTRVVFVGASKKPSFVTETCPLPSSGDLMDGEVLLKVRLATICAADLDTLDGKWTKSIPSVMGHEGVGEVLISKRRETDLSVGDRVVFSVTSRCEVCPACRRNLSVPCPTGIQYGHSALSNAARLSGTFASHLILRRGTHVVRLPDNVPDVVASPVNCPLATMVNATDLVLSKVSGWGEQKIAVIQGINIFAIYGCILLKESGFSEVYLTDPSHEQQKMAAGFGGIPSYDKKDVKRRSRLPPSCSVDVVVQTNGQLDLMPEGIDMLRPGGMYLLVGVSQQVNNVAPFISGEQIMRKELAIQGISGCKKHHLTAAVEFLSKVCSSYPLHELISPKFSLHDLPAAIRTARTGLYCRVAVTTEGMRTS